MYATLTDLTAWLDGGDYQPPSAAAAPRVLARAWEVVEEHLAGYFETDETTGLATDPDIITALTNAQCAQVEQWLEVGEENDIAGYPENTFMSTGISINRLPATLAPRARRILNRAGLLSGSPLGVKLV